MLALDHLTLAVGDFRLAAHLTVKDPGVTAIIGASGSGKSTLLAAIAGFLVPQSGRILWNGEDLLPLAPGQRPLTMLFQDQNLFPHLSAARNVALGLSPSLRLTVADWTRVDQALLRTGLAGLGARLPSELSGGQQARVALARMLLRARPLLLLDEAFAGLGPALKAEMLDLVVALATETRAMVLMVSHDPDDALRIAPQTILVADGMAHPPVSTTDLLANPPPSLRRYLGK